MADHRHDHHEGVAGRGPAFYRAVEEMFGAEVADQARRLVDRRDVLTDVAAHIDEQGRDFEMAFALFDVMVDGV